VGVGTILSTPGERRKLARGAVFRHGITGA
jgi:hypothetical protein